MAETLTVEQFRAALETQLQAYAAGVVWIAKAHQKQEIIDWFIARYAEAVPHAEAPPTKQPLWKLSPRLEALRDEQEAIHNGCTEGSDPRYILAVEIIATLDQEVELPTHVPASSLRVLAAELRAFQRYQVALVDATDKSVTEPSNESDSFVRWSDLQPIADKLDALTERPS